MSDESEQHRPAPSAAPLRVGAASVDLTPEAAGTYLAGFGFNRRALGVRDPITARCLFFESGAESVAIVAGDFVGLLREDVDAIRRRLGPVVGPRLLFQSTHTHAGPDTMGYWGPGVPNLIPLRSGRRESYMERVRHEVAACVERARAAAAPARLRCAAAAAPKELSKNIRKADHKDDTVTVLRAESLDGAGVGTLVHWTCHPETLWDRYRYLSADYPGALRPILDARLGGVTLFVNGALGGMVTGNIPDDASIPEREAYVETLGRAIADVAADAIAGDNARLVGPEGVAIRLKRAEVRLPVRNWRFRLARRLGILPRATDWRDRELSAEIAYLALGPVEIVGLPGEPLPSVGEAVKRSLSAPFRLVFGLSNDELGYILTEAEYHDPVYRYERTMSLGPKTWPLLEQSLRGLPKDATARAR